MAWEQGHSINFYAPIYEEFASASRNHSCLSHLYVVFRALDKDTDGFLSQEEWVNGLSIFLRGSLDEKMECELYSYITSISIPFHSFHSIPLPPPPDCFNIYDLNSDGYISREEMFQMLKTTMIRQPTEEDPDEGIKDMVEIMVKKMVRNGGHSLLSSSV